MHLRLGSLKVVPQLLHWLRINNPNSSLWRYGSVVYMNQ